MKPFARSVVDWLGFCVCLLLPLVTLQAQPPTHASPYIVSIKHLTLSVEQGPRSRQVLMVGQDKQGFVWAGTADNAYRFDGQRFEPLTAVVRPTDQQRFHTGFNLILTDRQGNLWLGGSVLAGERQLAIVRPGQMQGQPIEQAFGHPDPFRNDVIYDIAPSPTNSFQYVRTKRGTIWRHLGQGRFRKLYQHRGLTASLELMTYETDRQTLLVSYPANPTTHAWEFIELDSTGHVLQRHALPSWLRPIGKAADGSVYLNRMPNDVDGSPGKLLYQLSPTGKLTEIPVPIDDSLLVKQDHSSSSEIDILYDAKHSLFWLTGTQLLMAWHPQKGVVFELPQTDVLLNRIQRFHRVVVDRTGAVWVTTTNGALVLTLEPNRFQRYLHVPDNQPGVVHKGIRGMLQVGNQLWVNASESQLVDLKTGHSQLISRQTDKTGVYTLNLCPVVWGDDGMIWAGFMGIIRVDPQTFRVSPSVVYLDNSCVAMWPDGHANLWIGSQHGLSIFNTKTRKHQPFTRYNQFGELAQSLVNGFFSDKQADGIWVTASSGLYLLDTLRGITDRYSSVDQGRKHLPFDYITFVHPDPDQPGVYWLATRGGGLIRWNRRDGTWQQFTQKQGLSDNTLYAIYEDKYNRLWLPSNYGLMSFHRKTHQIKTYHTKEGIADEEFNLMAHHRGPDGRLFLGGLNGITAFYPDQIRTEKTTLSPMLVTQYQKLDTETGKLVSHFADYEQEKQIHLTASDRLFTLGFSLLDYRNLGQTRLWYRIKGWQEQWVVQDRLELSINGLPANDYIVQVRAQSANGDWASPVLSIPLTVDRPFYLQAWFMLLALLAVGGGGVGIFRWRNRQLVRDKIRLEAEVARRTAQIEEDKAIIEQQAADLLANAALKSRFFANVSHELRTPLTLLLGPLAYLARRITDSSGLQLVKVMERNAHQLLTLVNDILDLTKLDASQLTLTEQPTDLAQLIRQTVGHFTAQTQYIGVHLRVSGQEVPLWMAVDTPKLETVLRNLIANALNHTTTSGSIDVALSQVGNQAVIAVTDTGVGIHPDDLPHIFERYFQSNQPDKPLQGGTGIGLALCREYSLLWGGAITVSSQLGQGSTFTVSYPIHQATEPLTTQPLVTLPTPNGSAVNHPIALLPEEGDGVVVALKSLTILIVDDNADMLRYIQTILAPYYELLIARNGRQALDLLQPLAKDQLPNLIISDIMMPEVDGLALVQEIRSRPALRHIPLVLLTARADLDSRLQALRLGIADYLTKPFYEAELLARIQNLLNRVDEQAIWQQQVPDEPELVSSSLNEADWIQLAQQMIRRNLTNAELTISFLAELTHVSERQLYRRTKELTGLSPNQFIQEVRLQIAHELLTSQPQTMVKSIGYQVGYQKTSYFIQLYRERFGINPGEQLRQIEPERGELFTESR